MRNMYSFAAFTLLQIHEHPYYMSTSIFSILTQQNLKRLSFLHKTTPF